MISNDSNNRLRLQITWDLLLKMNKEKTKAGLIVSGKSLHEFTARSLIDKVAIYSDEFVIEGLRPFKITVLENNVLDLLK